MSVASSPPSVNTSVDLQTRLKRDVALHQAAQILANAVLVRAGLPPQPLAKLSPDDRAWARQTARQILEIGMTLIDAAAVIDEPTPTSSADERRRREFASELDRQRSRARVAAIGRGHDMGGWAPYDGDSPDEMSTCQRCRRTALLVVVENSVSARIEIVGTALTDGCLVAAESEAGVQ